MKRPVIIYDGECGLCSRTLQFVKERDKSRKFEYQSVVGPEAKKMTSLILKLDGKEYRQSEAILKILTELGGVWKVALLGWAVPSGIRNKIYAFISKHRSQF